MNWIHDHFETIEGFPRPNWETINNVVEQKYQNNDKNEVWCEISKTWVDKIKSVLSSGHSIYESPNFLILTSENSEYSNNLLKFLENARLGILKTLKDIANDEGYGKHIVLIFDSIDKYYSYISYYYPEEGEFGFSSGTYLNKGYGHFAFPHQEMSYAKAIVAHELSHALLDHLPLPAWLNEGIAVNIENMFVGSAPLTMDKEIHTKHKKFWDKIKIQEFWSGESFSRPDEAQELSYHLAQFLVHSLSNDLESFKSFVNTATFSDGGEEAASKIYDDTLGSLISQLLGKGEWAPQPQIWENNESTNTKDSNNGMQPTPSSTGLRIKSTGYRTS